MSVWRSTVLETASVCRMPRPPSSASAILALKEKNAQVSKSKTFCNLERASLHPTPPSPQSGTFNMQETNRVSDPPSALLLSSILATPG